MANNRNKSQIRFLWANVVVIAIFYAAMIAFSVWNGRRIGFEEVKLFWPIHIMLALNIFGIFGPTKWR